jgi:hypothetical protein
MQRGEKKLRSLAERFERKVDRTPGQGPGGDCHAWIGAHGREGHGQLWVEGRVRGAHVVAFYLAHGRWPTPCCRHTCDFPPCVREEHLIEGTQADNLRDAAERGRMANSRLTIEQVRAIRSDSRVQVVVAADYGISQATVSAIKTGRIRRYV